MTQPVPPEIRPADPDAEAAALAEARKAATEAGYPHCRLCGADGRAERLAAIYPDFSAPSPGGGWECADEVACQARQAALEQDKP